MSRRLTAVLIALILAIGFVSIALAAQKTHPKKPASSKQNYTGQLLKMVRHAAALDKEKKITLTSAQASKALGILKPLRAKPKLTQTEAKKAADRLKKVFTAAQIKAMESAKPRSSKDKKPDAKRPDTAHKRPEMPKDFNPFYSKAPKGDKHAEARVKMMGKLFAALEKKAKGK